MYCKKCKNVIKDNEYYCPYCGFNNKNDYIEETKPITTGDCFKNFVVKGFSGEGVATIKEFWLIFAIHIVLSIVLGVIGLNNINTILNIIIFIPMMALKIRRYHDTNKSGAFAILGGYYEIAYLFSFYTSNETYKMLLLASSIIALIIELILLSLPTNEKSRWNPKNGYLE